MAQREASRRLKAERRRQLIAVRRKRAELVLATWRDHPTGGTAHYLTC